LHTELYLKYLFAEEKSTQEGVSMNEEAEILKNLYKSEIGIDEASRILNISEEEVWNLLDTFDYYPSGEDLRKACEIEEETWRNLEKKLEKRSKQLSVD